MHSFVERGVPLFVTHGKNVKSNGRYLELRGLKDPYSFVTAVTNASAKQSIEAKGGRRHPMPTAPLNLELIRETIIITAVTLATSQMEEDVACLLVLTVVEHKRKLVRIE